LNKEYLGILAGVFSFAAYFPYIISIWKDRKKLQSDPTKNSPKRASWIIWFTTSVIILLTMESNQSMFAKYQAWAYGIGATVTLLFAIPYGTGGWEKSDKVYLAIALLGLILWWQLHSAWYAFALAMIVDIVGIFPIIKARGRGEDWKAWMLWSIGGLANFSGMLLIENKTLSPSNPALADILYPTIMTTLITVAALFVFSWKMKVWRHKTIT